MDLGYIEPISLSKRNRNCGKTLNAIHQHKPHPTRHVRLYVAVKKKGPWIFHVVAQRQPCTCHRTFSLHSIDEWRGVEVEDAGKQSALCFFNCITGKRPFPNPRTKKRLPCLRMGWYLKIDPSISTIRSTHSPFRVLSKRSLSMLGGLNKSGGAFSSSLII